MKTKLTSFIVILLMVMAMAAVVQAAPAGKVTNLEGRADVTAPGQPAKPLLVGDAVNVGDIIRTKNASKCEVTWVDGSIARLAANSRLQVTAFNLQKTSRKTILSLFRGKVQHIVTSTAKLFGAKGDSQYEVHTPTSVCGVRGTTFFTSHENGVSGSLFAEGSGYMYSRGLPGQRKSIAPGVWMYVNNAKTPPRSRHSTPGELNRFLQETTLSGKKKDEKRDDEGSGGIGSTFNPVVFMPDEEDTGVGGAIFTDVTEPVPDPLVPPVVPTETFTTFTLPVTLGELTGTLNGSIGDITNRGTLGLTGAGAATPYAIPVTGPMSDGSTLNAYLAGIPGSWSGLFTGLAYNAGAVSLLQGSLSDPNYTAGTLLASGTITRQTGYTVGDYIPDIYSDRLPVPLYFSDATYAGQGYDTSAGGLLAIWTFSRTGGIVPDGFPTETGSTPFYYKDYSSYEYAYIGTGVQTFNADTGHFQTVSNAINFMNNRYFGTISMNTQGVVRTGEGSYIDEVGTGAYTLVPLKYHGYWGDAGSLYYNAGGYLGLAGHEEALIGGITQTPWAGNTDFKAIGEYSYGSGYGGYNYYLWNTGLYGYGDYTGDVSGGYFEGFTAGIWGSGKKGSIRALYVIPVADGAAGILSSDDIAISLYPAINEADRSMWVAQGTLGPYGDLSYPAEFDPTTAGIGSNWIDAYATGKFAGGTDNTIFGEYNNDGTTKFITYRDSNEAIKSLPFGIYNLNLGYGSEWNSYSGKPAGSSVSWSAKIGDVGYFGPNEADFGVWIANIDGGNWDEDNANAGHGAITGNLHGKYLTSTHIGGIAGPFYGLYTAYSDGYGGYYDSGTWIGQSIGIYQGAIPLAFGGYWNEYANEPESEASLYYNSFGSASWAGEDWGLFGITDTPYEGTKNFLAMGSFDLDEHSGYSRYIWNSPISTRDVISNANNGNPLSGGDLLGYTTGIWRNREDDTTLTGAAVALYVSPDGTSAGLIRSYEINSDYTVSADTALSLTGENYPDLYMWEIAGKVNKIEKATGLSPETLQVRLMPYNIEMAGNFDGIGSVSGYAHSKVLYLTDGTQTLPWGIYSHVMDETGGTFSLAETKTVADFNNKPIKIGGTSGYGMYGIWIGDLKVVWTDDTDGSGGEIKGSIAGDYLTKTQIGRFSGPFAGAFDYNNYSKGESGGYYDSLNGTWIGSSVGTWEGETLKLNGFWNDPNGLNPCGEGGCVSSLYANDAGYGLHVGEDIGLLGVTENNTFYAMGVFQQDWRLVGETYVGGGSLLWNSPVAGGDVASSGEALVFGGFTGGIWKDNLMRGGGVMIYKKSDNTAGLMTVPLTGSYFNTYVDEGETNGYGGYEEGMWRTTGALTTVSMPVPEGFAASDYEIVSGYIQTAGFAGSFAGGGSISGTGSGAISFLQNTSTYTSLPWGLYNLTLYGGGNGNSFSDKPAGTASWSAIAGGQMGYNGYNGYGGFNGYWLATVKGSWTDDGQISGNVGAIAGDNTTFGTFLTPYAIGTLSGPFSGVNFIGGQSGTWIGQSIGAWEGTPLSFVSDMSAGITHAARAYEGQFSYSGYGGYGGYYSYRYYSDNSDGYSYHQPTSDSSSYTRIEYYRDGTTYVNVCDAGVCNSSSGTWDTTQSLSFLETPTPPEGETASLVYAYDNVAMNSSGYMSGLLGGAESLWYEADGATINPTKSNIPFTALGRFGNQSDSVWHTNDNLYSYNYKNGNYTTYDGGAYVGMMGGTEINNSVDGRFLALYIAPDGSAGYLKGPLSGVLYPGTGMFEMNGVLNRTQVSDNTGIAPEDLHNSVYEGSMSGNFAGQFTDGGKIYGYSGYGGYGGGELSISDSVYDGGYGGGTTLSIVNYETHVAQNWGIYGFALYGEFANPSTSAWQAKVGGNGSFGAYFYTDEYGYGGYGGDYGYWLADGSGTLDGTGKLTGALANGKFITYTRLGTLGGDLLGSLNATYNIWEAVSLGTYEGTPLSFVSEMSAGITHAARAYEGQFSYSGYGGYGGSYSYNYYSDNSYGYSYNQPTSSSYPYTRTEYYKDGTTYSYGYDESNNYFESYGTWDTTQSLSFLETPTPPEGETASLVYAYDNLTVNNSGAMNGLLGGAESLWYEADGETINPTRSNIPFTALGRFGNLRASIWHTDNLYSYNYLNSTYTTYDGGAYVGIMGGTEINNSVDGRFLALYIAPDGSAGYLGGPLSGVLYPKVGMFKLDGVLNRTQVSDNTGIAPEDLHNSIWEGSSMNVNLAGQFTGGGKINGHGGYGGSESLVGDSSYGGYGGGTTLSIVNYETRVAQDWGIYGFELYGEFANPTASAWTAKVGGSGSFGAYFYTDEYGYGGYGGDYGYWLADGSGTLDGTGKLSGALANGKFITYTRLGTLAGDLLGSLDAAHNVWEAVSLGAYEGTPLSFVSNISPEVRYYDGESGWQNETNLSAYYGLLGGTDSLWEAVPVSITALGRWQVSGLLESDGHIFSASTSSYNYINSTNTTYDQGAYFFHYGGGELNNKLDGLINGIYYDPDGRVGILYGAFTGANDSKLGGWSATGAIDGLYQLGTGNGSLSAENFVSSLVTSNDDWTYQSGDVIVTGDQVLPGTVSFRTTRINGAYLPTGSGMWGVWQQLVGGTYNNETSPSAWVTEAYVPGVRADYADVRVISTVDGITTGNRVGASAIYSSGLTVVNAGTIKGLFDPAKTTFQYVAQGTFMETSAFVNLVNSFTTDAEKNAFMAAMKIPAFNVGSMDLTGSRGTTGDSLSVTMAGVNFYASSTGQVPQIFATKDVTGTYDVSSLSGAVPAAVNLTASNMSNFSAASATFTPKVWDTANNKWGAQVSGIGTMTSPAVSIGFNGGAAGTLNNGTAGTLTGTAAGVVTNVPAP